MPALHCASTRRGVETMNCGAPMTGNRRRSRKISGMGILGGPAGLGFSESSGIMAVAMQFDTLIFEAREGIAYVTLNRPDRLNALSDPLVEDLRRAAAHIDSEPEIRAVLLTGAGRAFCAGADLTGDNTAASAPQAIPAAAPVNAFAPRCRSTSIRWSTPGINCACRWWSPSMASRQAPA